MALRSLGSEFQGLKIRETLGPQVGVSDTHVLLLNEYIVELNPAKFNILNQILNWIFLQIFELNIFLNWIFLIEYFFELNFLANFWIEYFFELNFLEIFELNNELNHFLAKFKYWIE